MLFKRILFIILLFWNTSSIGQNVFFNEIDHLNPDLCVELAVAPDIDLTDWFVTLYDDAGVAFDTISLTGVPPSSTTPSGYNIVEIDIVMLSPTRGGMSLVNNTNSIVQFISYGGELTAIDGPSAGQNAENIGTQTASGNSLQLQGVGSVYDDFNWGVPGSSTCGVENDDQELILAEIPLPVSLLYFRAMIVDNYVELKWATASEQNNAYFILERSADGVIFEEVGRLEGAINSVTETKYSYADYRPIFSDTYYRLVQVDQNGSNHYSEIIIVNFSAASTIFHVFPNPVEENLQIVIPPSSGLTKIYLYNILGEKVLQKTVNDAMGEKVVLELNQLDHGQYLLVIEQEGQWFQEKIIKSF